MRYIPSTNHLFATMLLGAFLTLASGAWSDAAQPPAPARTGEARIALVSAHPLDAARTLQDLALVALSQEKGIVLLQRDAVDKLLNEQKLNQSGLVEAKSAVQLGKVLAVDLIGVIDVSLEAKETLGFVVFDAATGVRLSDDGFALEKTDQQLGGIVKGVLTGAQKWRAGVKQLKTVCVLPVRNADLPRGMDAYCEAIAVALERQLVRHPTITTLERKWLDSVNNEKTIASAALSRELLASVLVVDLEIARGIKSKGVRGTVTVRDNAGKQLHQIEHQVEDEYGADLLGPLVKRLHAVLDTTKGSTLAEPAREARRFLHESEMLWKHKHHRPALRAAEAAYSILPDDASRSRLAECLLLFPREMWRKQPAVTLEEHYQFPPVERTAEELRTGLSMARRGQQLIDSAKPRVNELPDHGWFYSLAENAESAKADSWTWQAIRAIRIKPSDPSIDDDIREFRLTCLAREFSRLQEIQAMKRWTPTIKLQRLTTGLRSRVVTTIDAFAPDSASRQKALGDAARLWLDVARQIPAENFPAETAMGFAETMLAGLALQRGTDKRSVADTDAAAAIFKELRTHPHPVLRVYGAHFQMKLDLGLKRITAPEAGQRLRDNFVQAKLWLDQAHFKNPNPHRVAFYEFFNTALWMADRELEPKTVDDAYADISEYMLDHKDVPGWVMASLIGRNLIKDRGKLSSNLQVLYRFQEMYEGPNHRLFHDPTKYLPRQFKHFETMILQIDPTLAKQKLEAPWDKVITLAEARKIPDTSRLYTGVRHDDHVYFLAGVQDPAPKTQVYLQLLRAGLDGGEIQALGRLPITPRDFDGQSPRYDFAYDDCVIQGLVHGKHFIAGTARDGIFIFPLDGGVPARIGDKEGLPALEVNRMTALDNQVIASLNGGYLVRIDLATQRVEVLASSRRTNKLSPFDNDQPFYIRSLVPDSARQRVLFTVGVLGTFKHPSIGMWEYNLKTRAFKKHLPTGTFNFSSFHANEVYMEQYQQEWLARYDLAKDQFTLLQGKTPDGMAKQEPLGLPKDFTAKFPRHLYHAGYVWDSWEFNRRSLQNGKEQFLPHPARGYTTMIFVRECLEPGRAGELLVGDKRGLYVVHLKK